MSGKMPAAWWRAYRGRRRLSGNPVRRRPDYIRPERGDRSAEYAVRQAHRRAIAARRAIPPVSLLMPHLQAGARLSFWEDELRLDLAQERELARLEGRDPAAAVAAYRARETSWRAHIAPLWEGSWAA